MEKQTLTLYHYWRSSCSWRVRWALAIKGLPYESVSVDLLKGEQQGSNYALQAPTQYVPCLVINGKPFGESLAIIEYLEDMYPNPALLPKDPEKKLTVRQLSHIIASGTQPIQNLSVMRLHSSQPEEQQAWARHWIRKGLEAYSRVLIAAGLKDGAYSLGNEITLADLCLVPQVYNAFRFQVPIKDLPRLEEIYNNCLNLPACEQAAPQNQPGATPS